MPPSPIELLHEWRDFFIAIVTVSATLIGAMFVVASIGIGFFNRSHAAAIRSFLTPTVIHFSAVIVMCVLTMAPPIDWNWLGGGFAAVALGGIGYALFVALDVVRRRGLMLVDHFWYGLAPLVGYLAILAAAAMILAGVAHALELAAAGMVAMILGGIRNSWDMIVFILTQDRTNGGG